MPIFELDSFNEREKHHLGSCDAIVVCSEWARHVIQSNKIEVPTFVAPLGVDTSIFGADVPWSSKKTIFFNVGKWEYRKGHDVLVECFCKAFSDSDAVELRMFPDNPFLTKQQTAEWERLYKGSPLGDKIKIFPRAPTQQQLRNWLLGAHCGVFPSRAEGWNLDALEALACGKHLIITNATAHTEFCTTDNSRLIDVAAFEDAYDGIWFHGQGRWGYLNSPALDEVIESMREVHKLNMQNKLFLNEEGIETAQSFSWDRTATATLAALQD